jgi:hypothetical protein
MTARFITTLPIKAKYGFTRLEPSASGDDWIVDVELNPKSKFKIRRDRSTGRFERDPNAPKTGSHSRDTEYPSDFRAPVKREVISKATHNNRVHDALTMVELAPDDVSIEHKFPVVKHWNQVGYNLQREKRYDWFNSEHNLIVISKLENSRRGAALGITYRQDTGPNYT